ncbi:unnamed protein product [Durusdinium trenchii]|uniref:Ion transport domain-containing protein n=1 Tax=Durusdinium trenchii TaxID=1381693 RepID=A0ABP0NRM7_9DINO
MSNFRDLLRRLEEAHDQELSQLREELRQTRWASRKQTMTMSMDGLFDESTKEALRQLAEEGEKDGGEDDKDKDADMVGRTSSLWKKTTLEIFPEWEEDTGRQAPSVILARKSSLENEENRHGLDKPGGLCYANGVFRPEVHLVIIWQLVGVLVLGFDTLWVPMEVFPQDPSAAFAWVQGLTSFYWFLDIFVNMNTAIYSEKGEIDMRRWHIVRAYARSWLIFDVLLISLDVYAYMANLFNPDSTAAGAARSGRIARFMRIIRLLRLVRLAKLRQLLFALQSLIDSEWVTLMLAVVRNLAVILLSNHYIACLWFLIGTTGHDAEADCWVPREGIQDAEMSVQYMVSIQWSLAQFTPGASLIQVRCRIERAYYVFVLVYGLVLGTCFVSSITTIMNAVWSLTRYNTSQNFLLKKFLKENAVSRNLSSRILRYVDYVLELRHRRTHHSKVHYLQLLSGPLHWELQREIHSHTLNQHPVFAQYSATASPAISQICATALSNIIYAKKDRVFHQSKEAKEMYFLVSGAFVYYVKVTINRREIPLTIQLEQNSWSCEAALWLVWRTRGEMRALAESDALVVNSKKFREASLAYPAAAALGRAAAQSFYDHAMELSTTTEFGLLDVPAEVVSATQSLDGQGSEVLEIHRELQRAELQEAKSSRPPEFWASWETSHQKKEDVAAASPEAKPSEESSAGEASPSVQTFADTTPVGLSV